MKLKYLPTIFLILLFIGIASAQTFTPTEGNFAYREVENITINGINFTIRPITNRHSKTALKFTSKVPTI